MNREFISLRTKQLLRKSEVSYKAKMKSFYSGKLTSLMKSSYRKKLTNGDIDDSGVKRSQNSRIAERSSTRKV